MGQSKLRGTYFGVWLVRVLLGSDVGLEWRAPTSGVERAGNGVRKTKRELDVWNNLSVR